MLDLGSADTKSQSSKGAMGRGVAVTTNDGSAGEGEALLRTDNMDNALSLVAQAKVCDSKVLDILLQGDTLGSRVVLLDKRGDVLEGLAGGGGDVLWRLMLADAKIPGSDAIGKTYVVSGGQSAVWSSDFSASVLQALESLL